MVIKKSRAIHLAPIIAAKVNETDVVLDVKKRSDRVKKC